VGGAEVGTKEMPAEAGTSGGARAAGHAEGDDDLTAMMQSIIAVKSSSPSAVRGGAVRACLRSDGHHDRLRSWENFFYKFLFYKFYKML